MKKININPFCYLLLLATICVVFFETFVSKNDMSKLSETARSVVKIRVCDGFGSGSIVGKSKIENGFIYYVLTAAHLYDPIEITGFSTEEIYNYISEKMFPTEMSKIMVISHFPNGDIFESNKADLLCHDKLSDIMILTFYSQEEYEVIKISQKYSISDTVYSISYQLGLGLLFTDGLISRVDKEFIFSSDPIAPGASGGGLFIMRRNQLYLIGMIHAVGSYGGSAYPQISWNVRSKIFLYFLRFNNVPFQTE